MHFNIIHRSALALIERGKGRDALIRLASRFRREQTPKALLAYVKKLHALSDAQNVAKAELEALIDELQDFYSHMNTVTFGIWGVKVTTTVESGERIVRIARRFEEFIDANMPHAAMSCLIALHDLALCNETLTRITRELMVALDSQCDLQFIADRVRGLEAWLPDVRWDVDVLEYDDILITNYDHYHATASARRVGGGELPEFINLSVRDSFFPHHEPVFARVKVIA